MEAQLKKGKKNKYTPNWAEARKIEFGGNVKKLWTNYNKDKY